MAESIASLFGNVHKFAAVLFHLAQHNIPKNTSDFRKVHQLFTKSFSEGMCPSGGYRLRQAGLKEAEFPVFSRLVRDGIGGGLLCACIRSMLYSLRLQRTAVTRPQWVEKSVLLLNSNSLFMEYCVIYWNNSKKNKRICTKAGFRG